MPEQADLDDGQRRVLQMIYDRFREQGTWAIFGQIDRPLRKLGLMPETIIDGMPRDLLLPFQAGRTSPIGRDELQLTLKGIAVCDGGREDIDLLMRLMPWLAAKELEFEPGSDRPDESLRVSRNEIADFLDLPVELGGALDRLRMMIGLQRWGWSGGETSDGEWYIQVDRSIYRFGKVRTLDDYLAVMQQWEDEFMHPYAPIPAAMYGSLDTVPDYSYALTAEPEPYVPMTIVNDIESAAAQSDWDCAKLLTLIDELTDSWSRGKTYSSHAILRALLDHVPPLFGLADFTAVASNYGWSKTDKRYMKRLADFRIQADDVLHRQISKTADVLTIDDMPGRVAIVRLLQECAALLTVQKQVTTARVRTP